MIECIVCATLDCTIIHTADEISKSVPKKCYVCRALAINAFCEKLHTIEEIKNPPISTTEEMSIALRVCIAYAKLSENENG